MKMGFIGMGNMACAMVKGIARGASAADIMAYAPHQEKLKENAARLGFTPCGSLRELASACDILVVACKPDQVADALKEDWARVRTRAIVSIASGWLHKDYIELLGEGSRVQCIMPNTPCEIGEGVVLFEEAASLTEEEDKAVREMFSPLGTFVTLPSHLMAAGSAVSGCGPAFAYMMIEAYADAAVKYGIPRVKAYAIVAKTLAGAALLAEESGQHPGALKDAVCSPGGTTIRGVASLEASGFRSSCIRSIDAVMGAG